MTVGPIPDVDTNLKEQAILNRVYNDTTKSLKTTSSIQETVPTDSTHLNPSLTISNTDTTVASTKVLTKTIGSTSYTKTISYNAAGDVVSISAWSVA